MDPRQHVNPGDPIRLAASQINGLNRLLTQNVGFETSSSVEQPTPYTWAMAKNDTASTVSRWSVLAITGMAITPGNSSGSTSQFEQMPVLTGGTPSATTTAWCVAVEPIASGKIGKVAIGGAVQLKASDLGKATDAEVLWKDSSWALIRFSSGGGVGVKRGTFSAPWDKGSAKTVTDAVTSGKTYADVKNYFAAVGGTGTKACAIAYVAGEWILIAAECG